jgi:hypothetical protein
MRRISGFIISVMLLLPMLCSAQDTIRYPINAMKGIRLGVDFSKLLLPVIYKSERMGFEATADVHIKGNMFAAAEAGWLNVNLDKEDFHYRENGMYGKLGVDYNLLKSRRPNSNDIVFAGARYALSVFSHQADHITIPGHFWPDATDGSIPKNTMHAHWLELLLGVKAEVLKNLYAGMTFRLKFRIVSPKDDYSVPYLIPGYGYGNSGFELGINYCVSYNFHF